MASILCLDDATAGRVVEDTLSSAGHTVVPARTVAEAFQLLSSERIDLIVAADRQLGPTPAELVSLLAREGYRVPVISVSANTSPEQEVAALRAGALDHLTEPIAPDRLAVAVERALSLDQLRRESLELKREIERLHAEREFAGSSRAIRELLQSATTVAPTKATVLISGERGTGRKLLASIIHRLSDRRDRPYLVVNCASLPESVVESALFGHERGAVAGAIRRVEGALERAHGGTLVLDEVAALRPDLQFKLLRVLQEQEFERVGGTGSVRVDVRLIATTDRDLAAAVARGEFREDLFYRLAVVPLLIPPLRERGADIAMLALRLAKRAAQGIGDDRDIDAIAPDALALLTSQSWPGNVAELQHAIERAVVMTHERVLRAHHFQGSVLSTSVTLSTAGTASAPQRSEHDRQTTSGMAGVILDTLSIDDAERVLIQRALEVTGQNRTRAAALLGISVRTLRNKLNRKPEETRES